MARIASLLALFLALYWSNTEAVTTQAVLKSLVSDCPPMEIVFVVPDHCSHYSATPFSASGAGDADLDAAARQLASGQTGNICEMTVCGNGEQLKSGQGYCGVGQCSILGKSCIRGCIQGDRTAAISALKRKHPDIEKIA